VGTMRVSYTIPAGATTVRSFRNGQEPGVGDAFLEFGLAGQYDDRIGPGVSVAYYEVWGVNQYGEGPRATFGIPSTTPVAGPTPSVTAWSYSQVSLTWPSRNDVVGGMPGVFEVWDNGSYVTEVNVLNAATPGSITLGVGQDTFHRYQVRVRGTDGFYSPFGGELRVAIGHDAYTTSAPWSQRYDFANLSEGQAAFVRLPAGVTTSSMAIGVGATLNPSGPYIALQNVTENDGDPNGRQIWYVFNNAVTIPVGPKPNPWVETIPWSATGTDAAQGIYLGGPGWADNALAPGPQLGGNIVVYGTAYTNHPAVPNGYW